MWFVSWQSLSSTRVVVYLFLSFFGFVGDHSQSDVWSGGLEACVMLRGLLLGKVLRAGEGRCGEPAMQGSVSPLMRGTAICGEEALAFGAVLGEGFEDDSASCVVPVCVELVMVGWANAPAMWVHESARWHVSELV